MAVANMQKTKKGEEKQALAKASAAIRVANKAARDAALVLAKQSSFSPPMSKDDMEDMMSRVVLKTLQGVGIHVQNDEAIEEFRQDMQYMRAWRKTIQKTTKTGWVTFVTVAVTGFLGVLWVALRIAFTGHP